MKDSDFSHIGAFAGFLDCSISETFALLGDPSITVEHRKDSFDNNQDLLTARRMLEVYLSLCHSKGVM